MIQLVIFNKASKKLNEKDLWQFAFVYEFILLIIYPIFHISKLLHKPNKTINSTKSRIVAVANIKFNFKRSISSPV